MSPSRGRREEHTERGARHTALATTTIASPCGPLRLFATDEPDARLVGVYFAGRPTPVGVARSIDGRDLRPAGSAAEGQRGCIDVLDRAAAQLAEFFAGARRSFALPLAPPGTPFQRAVWAALCEIPCGETRSYAELARAIGRPAAVRAVGAANGANPLSIIVPCHRLVGSDGSLTGYAGGLPAKRWLIDLERGAAPGRPQAGGVLRSPRG